MSDHSTDGSDCIISPGNCCIVSAFVFALVRPAKCAEGTNLSTPLLFHQRRKVVATANFQWNCGRLKGFAADRPLFYSFRPPGGLTGGFPGCRQLWKCWFRQNKVRHIITGHSLLKWWFESASAVAALLFLSSSTPRREPDRGRWARFNKIVHVLRGAQEADEKSHACNATVFPVAPKSSPADGARAAATGKDASTVNFLNCTRVQSTKRRGSWTRRHWYSRLGDSDRASRWAGLETVGGPRPLLWFSSWAVSRVTEEQSSPEIVVNYLRKPSMSFRGKELRRPIDGVGVARRDRSSIYAAYFFLLRCRPSATNEANGENNK